MDITKTLTIERKQWIDNASYERLLERWRNAPTSDQIFQYESGKYYKKVMAEKRKQVGSAAHVAASKSIGW